MVCLDAAFFFLASPGELCGRGWSQLGGGHSGDAFWMARFGGKRPRRWCTNRAYPLENIRAAKREVRGPAQRSASDTGDGGTSRPQPHPWLLSSGPRHRFSITTAHRRNYTTKAAGPRLASNPAMPLDMRSVPPLRPGGAWAWSRWDWKWSAMTQSLPFLMGVICRLRMFVNQLRICNSVQRQ